MLVVEGVALDHEERPGARAAIGLFTGNPFRAYKTIVRFRFPPPTTRLQPPGCSQAEFRRRRNVDCFSLGAKAGTVRRHINTERESQPELESEDRDVHWSVAVFESAAKDAETQRNSMP